MPNTSDGVFATYKQKTILVGSKLPLDRNEPLQVGSKHRQRGILLPISQKPFRLVFESIRQAPRRLVFVAFMSLGITSPWYMR
jgi:hypothetical protein